MKKVGIIGCGWLGFRIAKILSEKFLIYTTTTTTEGSERLRAAGYHPTVVNFSDHQLPGQSSKWELIDDIDALIITIPISEKNCDASSLYNRIQNLASFIGDFKGQMFLMNSTGVYPDVEKEYSEEDLSIDNVSGERMMKNRYQQVNILRLAGLMGDGRLLSKYNVSNLDAVVNHVHYLDIAAIIMKMMELGLEGKLYNVVAPLHPTKAAVINAQKNIPYSEEGLPEGRRISSAKLISELGFVFKYPDPRYFHLTDGFEPGAGGNK